MVEGHEGAGKNFKKKSPLLTSWKGAIAVKTEKSEGKKKSEKTWERRRQDRSIQIYSEDEKRFMQAIWKKEKTFIEGGKGKGAERLPKGKNHGGGINGGGVALIVKDWRKRKDTAYPFHTRRVKKGSGREGKGGGGSPRQ